MTASIDYLPIWKKDATAEEWLLQVAAIARKHPERFDKVVLIYESRDLPGTTASEIRYACNNVNTDELLGILVQTIEEVHIVTRGQRIRK